MKMNWHRFAEVVKILAPIVLTTVNPALGPIASVITHGIIEAEGIPGATGIQKAEHVKNIVTSAASVIPNVNTDAVNESLQEGIDTVIAAVKIFKK